MIIKTNVTKKKKLNIKIRVERRDYDVNNFLLT